MLIRGNEQHEATADAEELSGFDDDDWEDDDDWGDDSDDDDGWVTVSDDEDEVEPGQHLTLSWPAGQDPSHITWPF